MVEASRKVNTTVGLLSLPEVGVRQAGEALMDLKTVSWRTSATNSRSELVMVPSGLVKLTRSWVMSVGHFPPYLVGGNRELGTGYLLGRAICGKYYRCDGRSRVDGFRRGRDSSGGGGYGQAMGVNYQPPRGTEKDRAMGVGGWLVWEKGGARVGEVSREKIVDRALIVEGAAGVGRKGEARGSSVQVTGTGARDSGCVCVCD